MIAGFVCGVSERDVEAALVEALGRYDSMLWMRGPKEGVAYLPE